MFDDLTPKSGVDSEAPVDNKKSEYPLGGVGNVPANLSPNPSPSLSSEGGVASVDKGLKSKSNEEFDKRIKNLEEKGKKRGVRFSRIGLLVGALIALAMMGAGYYLLTQVIGITEQAQISVENIPNIGRENGREEKNNEINNLEITDEMLVCEVDDDCVAVMVDCCDCESSFPTAININFEQEWSQKLYNNCLEAECPETNVCPSGQAVCDSLLCRYELESEKCITEGISFLVSENQDKSCCSDLLFTQKIELANDQCEDLDDEAICINCGDGICGVGENYCNCPIDCQKEINSASSTEEIIIEEEGMCQGEDCFVDTDGDGLFDEDEEALGTDINNPDTDGDGLLDGDELFYGTDLLNPDTDGDSYLDGSEVANGYNPLGDGLLN